MLALVFGGSAGQAGASLDQSRPPTEPDGSPTERAAPPLVVAEEPPAERAAPFVRVRTVVIDPGHGGHDGGAIGVAGVPEKVLALRTSLLLRAALLKEDPTLEVVLTRTDDSYPELGERAHLAEVVGADALLSIHYNWAHNPEAEGIETFHIAPEGTTPGEAVPGRPEIGPSWPGEGEGPAGLLEASIVADLSRTGAIELSRTLALEIQTGLIEATGAPSRGVRSAQFRVLRGTTVPAVVCELGFLSHASEGKRIFEDSAISVRVAGMVAGLRAWDAWLEETGLTSEAE